MTLPPDYQAALDYIFNYVDYERRRSVPYTETAWDLARTRRALHALDDPHLGLRYVHVAGSKGKGSTAANVDAVLRASGLRTGFYTSPHLHTFRERIRIDGQLIGQEDVVRLLDRCKLAIESVPGITTFEIITLLALLHFAQQAVDWVVLEVGLGGRLDATNVVTPAVSVITPISYEHTALLGDTLDLIAREKAGIIKPGVPVVVAPQHAEALAAIEEVAARQQARLILAGRNWTWRVGIGPAGGAAHPAAWGAPAGQRHDRHRRLRRVGLAGRAHHRWQPTSRLSSGDLAWPDRDSDEPAAGAAGGGAGLGPQRLLSPAAAQRTGPLFSWPASTSGHRRLQRQGRRRHPGRAAAGRAADVAHPLPPSPRGRTHRVGPDRGALSASQPHRRRPYRARGAGPGARAGRV